MSYNLMDWFIDACDRGQCLSCKGFSLERMGDCEAQCYGCGRWFDGYDLGRYYGELLHLSTAHQKQQSQREHMPTYDHMRYEEELSKVPESYENYGNLPE